MSREMTVILTSWTLTALAAVVGYSATDAIVPARRYAAIDLFAVSPGGRVVLEKSVIQPVPPASTWTQFVQVVVQDATPPAPTNLAAVDLLNGRDVRITWDCAASPLTTSFEIQRERLVTPPATWGETAAIAVPDPGAREWTDPAGVGTWRYRIRSRNDR